MAEFNLSYEQLKEKVGLKKSSSPSDQIIHRWIQMGLIARKKNYHSRYSEESVEQLKLCVKLRTYYGKTTHEMQMLFDNYSLPYLAKRIERISGEELSDMINKARKKNK